MTGHLTPVPADSDEEAALWCLRLADGAPLTPEEEVEFGKWIAEPANAAAFRDQAHLWELTDAAASTPEVIQLRTAALESYRSAQAQRWSPPLARWHRGWMAAAVAMLVMLVIGAGALLHDPATTYRTSRGERRIVMLEDGSRLSLDADTEVAVRMREHRRDLKVLSGRAKFDVAKNPLRPFVVAAGDHSIMATGTAFSVELVGTKLAVLLYEGHVSVFENGRDAGGVHVMKAGTMLEEPGSGRAAPRIRPIDDSRSLAWEGGQLSFAREPLADALVRVNRYAARPIEIGDRAAAAITVTGVFDAGDTEAFLEGLVAVSHVAVDRRPDRILVTGP